MIINSHELIKKLNLMDKKDKKCSVYRKIRKIIYDFETEIFNKSTALTIKKDKHSYRPIL